MKKTILLILALLPIVGYANCGNKSMDFCQVKMVDIYDGDTFYVDIPKLHTLFGKRLGIRVWGVNTPEMRGGNPYSKAKAKEAKMFTKTLLENAKRIDLKECSRGKFFRIVCKVEADGKSLSEALIESGLAIKYMEK